jgi:hypothetical protein
MSASGRLVTHMRRLGSRALIRSSTNSRTCSPEDDGVDEFKHSSKASTIR